MNRDVEERLARRAEELDRTRRMINEDVFTGDQRDASGELSMVDQHPADVADFTYERELRATTRQILNREAEQVREAMDRVAQGTYGICQDCGQPIPPERLQARPEATRCVACQRAFEQAR